MSARTPLVLLALALAVPRPVFAAGDEGSVLTDAAPYATAPPSDRDLLGVYEKIGEAAVMGDYYSNKETFDTNLAILDGLAPAYQYDPVKKAEFDRVTNYLFTEVLTSMRRTTGIARDPSQSRPGATPGELGTMAELMETYLSSGLLTGTRLREFENFQSQLMTTRDQQRDAADEATPHGGTAPASASTGALGQRAAVPKTDADTATPRSAGDQPPPPPPSDAVLLRHEQDIDRTIEQGGHTEPELGDLQRRKAQVQADRGNMEQARDTATLSIKTDPNNARAWSTLARANLGMGDQLGAHQAANQALALNPRLKSAKAVSELTREAAEANASTALGQLQGDQPKSLLGLGWSLQRESEKQGKAIDGARPSGAKRGENAVSKKSLTWSAKAMDALLSGDAATAMQAARMALKEDPRNGQAFAALAMALNKLGRFAEAAAAAQAAIDLDAETAEAFAALAWARYKTGDMRGALEASDRALARKENAFSFVTKGLAWEGSGQIDKMFQDFEAAADLDPEAFAALLERARKKYADRGNPDLGLDLEPDFSPFLILKGTAGRLMRGDLKKALPLALLLLGVLGGGAFFLWGVARRETPTQPTPIPQAQVPTAAPAVAAFDTPAVRARFTGLKEIGRGGMGIVYEAYEASLNRKVAIKRMNTQSMNGDRPAFLREARVVAKLKHPAIVTIHDIVEENGELLLVFEHVAGLSLAQRLERDGALGRAETARLLEPVVQVLDYAHAKGVLHRDIKPGNIMQDQDGRVKVMDFGIARVGAGTLSHQTAATVVGTPVFMAPEQERGAASKAADYYALAVSAYQLITGELPFPLSNPYAYKVKGEFQPTGNGLDAFFARALDPDPAKRLREPDAFLDALRG